MMEKEIEGVVPFSLLAFQMLEKLLTCAVSKSTALKHSHFRNMNTDSHIQPVACQVLTYNPEETASLLGESQIYQIIPKMHVKLQLCNRNKSRG